MLCFRNFFGAGWGDEFGLTPRVVYEPAFDFSANFPSPIAGPATAKDR